MMIARAGDMFTFASEAKAILTAGDLRAKPDLAVLSRFLGPGYPFDLGDTVFQGIELLPAAHNLIVTAKGVQRSRYWSYPEQQDALSTRQADEAFRSIFTDAVRIRLRADVPVGVLLSGGIDSTSIVAQAAQHTGAPRHAFTATFPGFVSDETKYANTAAAGAGMSIRHVAYDPATFIEDTDSLVWHLESPLVDAQVFSRWHLLSAASSDATVTLEGQGADEMLAGYYYRYRSAYRHDERAAISATDFIPRLYRLAMTSRSLKDRTRKLRGRFRHSAPQTVSQTGILAPTLSATEAPADPNLRFPDRLSTLPAYDHSRAILPTLLTFGDRIAMAHAVESRLPLLDHRLVELVFSLPFDAKMRGRTTKHILRRSIGADLPRQILKRRRKVGFATPYDRWIEQHYAKSIRPLLLSPIALDRDIFDADRLRSLVDRHDRTRTEAAVLLRAYSVVRWYQRFVDAQPATKDASALAAA